MTTPSLVQRSRRPHWTRVAALLVSSHGAWASKLPPLARPSVSHTIDDDAMETYGMEELYAIVDESYSDQKDRSPQSQTILASSRTSQSNYDSVDNEGYKSQEEWWKDPLALFDEDEEENDGYEQGRSAGEELQMISEDKDGVPHENKVGQEHQRVPLEELFPNFEKTDGADPAASSRSEKPSARKSTRQIRSASGKGVVKVPPRRGSTAISTDWIKTLPMLTPTLLPKLQQVLVHLPATKVMAALALGTGLTQLLNAAPKWAENGKKRLDEAAASKNKNKKKIDSNDNVDDAEQEAVIEPDEMVTEREAAARAKQRRRRQAAAATSAKNSNLALKAGKGNSGGGWMSGWRAKMSKTDSRGQRIPSAHKLLEQVQELQRLLETAAADKTNAEREYEKASWQLQESVSELSAVKSTTRYLQSQLKENEEMLARVVQTERLKAKEELVRMKEAMVLVVEREREAMRDEFMKQAAELQTLWKREQHRHRQQAAKRPPSRRSSAAAPVRS